MQTKQHTTQNSSIARTSNLVNANSVDDVYVYRDGDDLAISSPVQTAQFHLDDLVFIYEGQLDVFEAVFEGAGDIQDLFWTPDGFQIQVYYQADRHQIRFITSGGNHA